jgi:hypothetical protein
MLLTRLVLSVVGSAVLLGQLPAPTPSSPASTSSTIREFPVMVEEYVVAGKTPVGTKVMAKLQVATLVNGTVLPKNAIFSGEVLESAAKTKTDPSRLAVRMDSVRWKNGSAEIRVYLTPWYYPVVDQNGQNLQYGPPEPAKRTWNGLGQYPDTTTKVYRPFPGGDSDKSGGAPDTPTSILSKRRIQMKDVDSVVSDAGAIAIVSKTSNLKLDKLTIYVLATGDLLPAK